MINPSCCKEPTTITMSSKIRKHTINVNNPGEFAQLVLAATNNDWNKTIAPAVKPGTPFIVIITLKNKHKPLNI